MLMYNNKTRTVFFNVKIQIRLTHYSDKFNVLRLTFIFHQQFPQLIFARTRYFINLE